MKKIQSIIMSLILTLSLSSTTVFASSNETVNQSPKWIGAWAASMQQPYPSGISNDGFKNQTIRMIVHPHASGQQVRLRFSNFYGTKPLTLGEVKVALSGGENKTISGTSSSVTFGGKESVTIPAGEEIFSDAISFNVVDEHDLAVSVYVPESTGKTTWHALSNQTAYYSTQGDQTYESDGTSFTKTENSWFWLRGVDVLTNDKNPRVIVTLGDSITDGDHSTLNNNSRYPDFLDYRLDKLIPGQEISVLNEGISGNRITGDLPMNGQRAIDRMGRDVLSQTGVTDVILLEGTNDIAKMPHNYNADQIIDGMKQIAKQAHEKGLRIYAGTILPFRDASYLQYQWTFTEEGEKTRKKVNEWIRNNKEFDGYIDLEKVMADPKNPERMLAAYDCGDHVHPNDTGYKAMSDTFDLSIFKTK